MAKKIEILLGGQNYVNDKSGIGVLIINYTCFQKSNSLEDIFV